MEPEVSDTKEVTVLAFGGRRVRVMAIKDLGEVVLVCRREELEASRRENRAPVTVGIRKDRVEGAGTNGKAR
jgi:hypothetical protein